MNTKRALMAALAAALVMFLVGFLEQQWFGERMQQDPLARQLMREPAPSIARIFLGDVFAGLLLALVFAWIVRALPPGTWLRGAIFGLICWMIGLAPIYFEHLFMNFPIAWTWTKVVEALVYPTVGGITISLVYRE